MVKTTPDQVILGISAYYHDSAAALLVRGNIIAAAQEERFTRKKHDPSFPRNAIEYCLKEADIKLADVGAIVFYDKPFLKFERLLETVLLYAPRGFRQFLASMTIWVKEKLFLESVLVKELKKIGVFDRVRTKLLFSEHHLSHAASAFYPSPFVDAAILTIDGVGEWATASICLGNEEEITLLKELNFPHSVGLLYSAFTYYLGFKVNSGEYKLMGLAPYGAHNSSEVDAYKKIITEKLITIYDDGSIFVHQEYFNYAAGITMVRESKWEKLFKFPRRAESDELLTHHSNLALAIQEVIEDIIVKMVRHAQVLTGARNLVLAGGVALNCVGNSKIIKAGIFDSVWIQPAAGDAGGALGAALAVHYLYFVNKRSPCLGCDHMKGSYLGPSFTDAEVEVALKNAGARWIRMKENQELCEEVANLIEKGNVVGWFQGRMEWGPRALGNRSILADPRNIDMQKKLNLKIKFREGFRPFAPSVIFEDTREYFDFNYASPYMLVTAPITEKRRVVLPNEYESLPWRDKLYYTRSDLPAITHLDYSARLQTVHKETNPLFHQLLSSFKKKTKCAVLVNTSFNVRGEPIVCTPTEAYLCFMKTHMDALAIGSYLLLKKDQPAHEVLELEDLKGVD